MKPRTRREKLKVWCCKALEEIPGRVAIDNDAREDSPDELGRQIYRSHVLKGKELLELCKNIPDVAKTVALTHHEREDGYKQAVTKRTKVLEEMAKQGHLYDYIMLKSFLKFVANLSL